jgi:hypothetical protein
VLAYPPGVTGEGGGVLAARACRGSSLTAPRLFGLPPSEIGSAEAAWLEREPRICRMVDGFPGRMDRLTAVGNAVVPQVAEFIGRQMMGAHGG